MPTRGSGLERAEPVSWRKPLSHLLLCRAWRTNAVRAPAVRPAGGPSPPAGSGVQQVSLFRTHCDWMLTIDRVPMGWVDIQSQWDGVVSLTAQAPSPAVLVWPKKGFYDEVPGKLFISYSYIHTHMYITWPIVWKYLTCGTAESFTCL